MRTSEPAGLVARGPSFTSTTTDFGDGATSPRAVLEWHLERIALAEPDVRAFVVYDLDAARTAADAASARWRAGRPLSPIDGMAIGVKDIVATAAFPTRMNSPLFADAEPDIDAACVRAVRDGGGIVVGKTVTTEFATGASGPTVNPNDPARTPGGSSSGAAAAAAAGMVAAGFGTQTLGSILRPAAFCGVVGYKPSFGALSLGGIHPVSASLDHLGVIAPHVEDAWRLARWVAERAPGHAGGSLGGAVDGPLQPLPPRRLTVLRLDGWMRELEPSALQAFEDGLDRLRQRGVTIVEPAADPLLTALTSALEPVAERALDLMAFDMRWPYLGYRERQPDGLSRHILDLLERGLGLDLAAYAAIHEERRLLRSRVTALAGRYDGFLLPAGSGPAPIGLANTGSRTTLTYWTFLGLPAISLPLLEVDGLPMGLQLAGFASMDRTLVRQAAWLLGEPAR